MKHPYLVVLGASARAASFSAARAGFSPWWIDQYGDTDLRAAFPGTRVPADGYPQALPALLEAAPEAPVMVTGAMENHLAVLEQIAARRELLGNGPKVCRNLRDPGRLRECFSAHAIAVPDTCLSGLVSQGSGRWLAKPRRGAGGLGIGFHEPGVPVPNGFYLQRYMEGKSRSAVYTGDGERAVLLGVTSQLVGHPDFHAGEFSYCGSIGPLLLDARERSEWERIGSVLACTFHLRGLFGVDAIRAGGAVVPVEVNPRYTASVEVIERATGSALVARHVQGCHGSLTNETVPDAQGCAGKAYLFAPRNLRAPDPGTLRQALAGSDGVEPADLPAADEPVRSGAPLMTLLAKGDDEHACARLLSLAAQEIYGSLGMYPAP